MPRDCTEPGKRQYDVQSLLGQVSTSPLEVFSMNTFLENLLLYILTTGLTLVCATLLKLHIQIREIRTLLRHHDETTSE
jgi:hypothetical protein